VTKKILLALLELSQSRPAYQFLGIINSKPGENHPEKFPSKSSYLNKIFKNMLYFMCLKWDEYPSAEMTMMKS
jgi:hypothetical protein